MNGAERSNDGVTLRKCPFCGGEAILESDTIGKGKELWYVSCKSDCVTQYGYCTTKERAIDKWNTRRPVERALERLKDENMNRVDMACMTMDVFVDGQVSGLERAIDIIEEEV
jgi:hypothetical protein